jgi:hypothetical protein
VAGERRDFLLDRREASSAWRVWPFVDLGLSLEGGTIRLWRGGLLRGRERTEARRDYGERQCA